MCTLRLYNVMSSFLRKDFLKHQLFLTPSMKYFVLFAVSSFEPTLSCPSEFARGGSIPEWTTVCIMEMEPAVDRERRRRQRGPRRYCTALLGCGKGKRRTSTSINSTLRGLPQIAGVPLPRSADESLPPHVGSHPRQGRSSKGPLVIRALESSRRKPPHRYR